MRRLTDMGYRFGVLAIDAALFVPQSRERIFVVAVDETIAIPASLVTTSPAAPFHSPNLVKACQRNAQHTPIWFNLPAPPRRHLSFADIIEDAPTGVSWHSRGETDRLIGMMAPMHLAKLEAAQRASLALASAWSAVTPDACVPTREAATSRAKGPAGRDPFRRCRRMPARSWPVQGRQIKRRRLVEGDAHGRRRRCGAVAAHVAARMCATYGPGRHLQVTRQLRGSLRPDGRRTLRSRRSGGWPSTFSSRSWKPRLCMAASTLFERGETK